MVARFAPVSTRALLGLLVSAMGLHAVAGVVALWKMLSFQMPITWSETVVYLSAIQEGGLIDLYSASHLTTPPIIVSIYGPVYYAALKLAFALFGNSFLVGRMISVSALLCIPILLYVASPRLKIFAPMLFLGLFPIFAWRFGSVLKPEYLAVCLSLAGMVLYLRQSRYWLIGAVVLTSLALLTKPTILGGFGAISCSLFLRRRYKQGVYFTLSTLLIVLIAYGALSWATDGGFWSMTVAGNAAKLDVHRIWQLGFAEYLQSTFFLFALAGSGFFLLDNADADRTAETVSLYFVLSLVLSLFALARPGSAYTYFLEPTIGVALIVPLLFHPFAAHAQTLRFLVSILGLALFAHLPRQASLAVYSLQDDSPRRQRVQATLRSLAVDTSKYVLADSYYTYDLVKAGDKPLIYDNLQYHVMSVTGIVSYDPIFQLIRDGRVPYVILDDTFESHYGRKYTERFWPTTLLDTVKQNYECRSIFGVDKAGRRMILCSYQSRMSPP